MITKTAMITICGRPNVGKSTLTNALVGEKIAIVSNKPQTTRNRISAVVNRGDTQLILMDTPGFHKPRNRLGDYMVQVVRESVADVDGVMLVVEPIASVGEQERALIKELANFSEEIRMAARDYDPSYINRYLMRLAGAFHRFYNACRILDAEGTVQQGRIALCLAVRGVIHNILTMFKVNAPETM